ncbi:MAG: topoisomerase DNA-binding C4 zinc finger domain-containing protein [Candidatus Odinarchaeota archaeon]
MSDRLPTELLTDHGLNARIGDQIKLAKKELIFISPWIALTSHQEEDLKKTVKDGANVTLLTRKPGPQDDRHKDMVTTLQKIGVKVFFDDLLQTKLVLTDRSAVILSSTNILPASKRETHGVALYSEESVIVQQAIEYVQHLEGMLGYPITDRSNDRFVRTGTKIKTFVGGLLGKKKEEDDKEKIETCPDCGKPLVVKEGKTGRFWGCTGFPDCRYTRNIEYRG